MTRFIFFLSATLLVSFSCQTEKETPITMPNIVFVLADDLGYGDLSLTGQTKFSTPHIDNLAQDGIFFTQHYSGSTVCAPSRSALLTGLHTGHTFMRGNKEVKPEGQYPLPADEITLSRHLQINGYTTGAFGKWGLGYPRSSGEPLSQGFDEFYGYNCQRVGHNYYPYHLWDGQDSIVLEGNSGYQTEDYGPDLIHKKALAFIDEYKDKPFFLYYPSIIPHAELTAPQTLIDSFAAIYGDEKPYQGIDSGPTYKNGGYGSQAHPRAAFAAMMTVLDRQVGELRSALEKNGIAENTIFIFTSDNGPHKEGGADPDFFDSNAELKGHKRDLYEGGIRVPLLVVWPEKIKGGQRSELISAFWDFFPTLCDAAGLTIPDDRDGISMLPTWTGDGKQVKHDHLYWEFHEHGGKQAIRKDIYKAIRLDVNENPDNPLELYDLSSDLGEENNIAADHPDIVRKMDSLMRASHVPSEVFPFASR